MDFSVKIVSTEKSVPLTMESTETIDKIKQQIQDKEGIAKDHQELIFRGNRLQNNLTLRECNVQKGCTLNLVSPKVEIVIKMSNDKTISLEMDQSDIVINLKKKIVEKLGKQLDLKLDLTTQDGLKLEDGRSISRYNLQKSSILNLNPENKPLPVEEDSSDDDERVFGSRRAFSNLTLKSSNSYTQSTFQGQSTVVQEPRTHQDFPHKKMQIFVKTMTGKTITLDVESQFKIEMIREIISDRDNIPATEQILIFSGKELENGRTLTYYNIKHGDTLQLVMRMRGGM